jgi:hypothetical protein
MAFLFEFEANSEERHLCIPMEVRLKLDLCGVKLQVSQWQTLSQSEQDVLADLPFASSEQLVRFRQTVKKTVFESSGVPATDLRVETNPPWDDRTRIPARLQERALESGCELKLKQWAALTSLQRFALIKLVRPGHENRNFLPALREFGLL